MFEAVPSPYLVDPESFRIKDSPTKPPKDTPSKKDLEHALEDEVDQIAKLQRVLYAEDQWSLLLVFQAMDAAGKDGTIRAVLSGVNPAGCQVHSFKAPSSGELEHDFLWRTTTKLPERGRIGIFNRSYYEEVLIVRVHPGILDNQRIPDLEVGNALWDGRLESIRDHEAHLARNGTAIVKFFLNVSKDEQRDRFLDRLDEPDKNWKFNAADVAEREHWDDYMHAYEQALRGTSRPWAPWYAIPADNKRYMRLCVARVIRESLESLGLDYPTVSADDRERFGKMRKRLES
ncbi:MAG: polyphosphate kinase 2 family protein [Planctomycetota bacterium]